MPAAPKARLKTCLRRRRRPVAAIAIFLLIWQALAAGLVVAEAAALAASGYDAGVICHGDGSLGGPSDRGNHGQDCCVWCMAASTPVLPGRAPGVPRLDLVRAGGTLPALAPAMAISPRAVRDGFSQAPPTEA